MLVSVLSLGAGCWVRAIVAFGVFCLCLPWLGTLAGQVIKGVFGCVRGCLRLLVFGLCVCALCVCMCFVCVCVCMCVCVCV